MVVQVLPRGQHPICPLVAVKQTFGTQNQKIGKPLVECTRPPDQLGNTYHPYSNLLGHLGNLKKTCV